MQQLTAQHTCSPAGKPGRPEKLGTRFISPTRGRRIRVKSTTCPTARKPAGDPQPYPGNVRYQALGQTRTLRMRLHHDNMPGR